MPTGSRACCRGDLGESMRIKEPVLDLIAGEAAGHAAARPMAMVIALLIGIPAGIVSAVKKDTAGTTPPTVRAVGHLDAEFLARHHADLAVLGEARLAAGLGLCAARRENWRASLASTIMPAFVLGNAIAAVLMRHTRSAMLQVLESDYVRTARAKGLAERTVILKHAMRNALTPVITLGALEFGTLLSGAVLTEQIFTIPGLRQAHRRCGVQPRLRGRAGRRAGDGDDLHRAQSPRRHRLCPGQSAAAGLTHDRRRASAHFASPLRRRTGKPGARARCAAACAARARWSGWS